MHKPYNSTRILLLIFLLIELFLIKKKPMFNDGLLDENF